MWEKPVRGVRATLLPAHLLPCSPATPKRFPIAGQKGSKASNALVAPGQRAGRASPVCPRQTPVRNFIEQLRLLSPNTLDMPPQLLIC